MTTIKLAILDDHDLIVEAIKSIVDEADHLEFVKGFSNYAELRNYLSENSCPDVLLLDIQLKNNEDGIKICSELSKNHPQLRIMMLSSITQPAIVTDAIKKGAKGFLPKNIDLSALETACETLMEGNIYVHQDISFIPQQQSTDYNYLPKITRREKEVLKLIMEELTSTEIAERLYISPNTVENHRASLFTKTGAKNIVGLIKYTIEKGLIDDN